MSTDFTAIADPVERERAELGHHPRRPKRKVAPAVEPGWYRVGNNVLYQVGSRLLYRIDGGDGDFQVVKFDQRPGHEFRGNFGPRLQTWIGVKSLVEADAARQMKARRS